MSLDDQDVSQLLPVKGSDFDLEVSMITMPSVIVYLYLSEDLQTTWSGGERQHALGKEILLFHPEDEVDSFNLYIKGAILLSRVKSYNLRFRAKRFMGDPAFLYAATYAEVWEKDSDEARDGINDARRTSGFIEIDHIASMFRSSFPLHLRHPIRDGSVDSHLYTASLMPHLCANYVFLPRGTSILTLFIFFYSAVILLHDPHAHVYSPGCVSAFKILEASRNILDLIYTLRSTSFDATLLDYFCAVRILALSSSPFLLADVFFNSFVGSWLAECWCAFGKPHMRRNRKNKS
jgi:hypothetical protein